MKVIKWGTIGLVAAIAVLMSCSKWTDNPTLQNKKVKSGKFLYEGYYSTTFGVYNSDNKQIEWKNAASDYLGSDQGYGVFPYFGVYNPNSQQVEWKKASSDYVGSDIKYVVAPYFGVYDPSSQQVEWKKATTDSTRKESGHVKLFFGVLDPTRGSNGGIEWKQN